LRKLVERAEKGDPTTLPVIRKMLEKPENIELLKGNLARISLETFAIEHLLVERVVACWLQLHAVELWVLRGR
jgi:hypothetical protein